MQNTLWRGLKATADIPENPTVLAAALVLTGLVTSMVLARETTDSFGAAPIDAGRTPAGVFRAPYPAIVGPGAPSLER